MKKYQVGRIEGRWTNFLPPIQGGKFRTRAELDALESSCEEVTGPETDDNSSNDSITSSPLFDGIDNPNLRQRRNDTSKLSRSSSSTSVTSIDLGPSTKAPKMGHMDLRTLEEINLDLAKYPSLDAATQEDIVQKYRALNARIRAEGLYDCRYYSYAIECCRYALLFGLFLYFLRKGWYGTSGFFIGLFWHQLAFTAHDAGHMGITHNFHVDSVIGILIANFLGGLSLGWWKRTHNVHHIVTNSPEHDPDIEHLPFFAVSHRLFSNLYSTYHEKVMVFDGAAEFFVRYQNFLYYIVLLFGRFNLCVQSWIYLLSPTQAPRRGPAWWHRYLEFAGQAVFWYWWGYQTVYRGIPSAWGRFVFVLISYMVTSPLHVQITLSHFAMSTSELGPKESFPQRMLRTTMDVDCPQWLDFVHGGLQFQAIHHLYPRIPRHNLRRTQKLVMEFCREVGIPYALYGFIDGNKQVIGHLGDVGRQVAILKMCQQTIVESEGFHMH